MTVWTREMGFSNKVAQVEISEISFGDEVTVCCRIIGITREVIRKEVEYVETRDSWAPDDFNMGGGVAHVRYFTEVFNYDVEDLADWEREELSHEIASWEKHIRDARLKEIERAKVARIAIKAREEEKLAKAREREVKLEKRRLARLEEEASRKEREAKKDADTWASANPFAALKGVIDD